MSDSIASPSILSPTRFEADDCAKPVQRSQRIVPADDCAKPFQRSQRIVPADDCVKPFRRSQIIVPSTRRFEADDSGKPFQRIGNFGAFEVYKIDPLYVAPNRKFEQITLVDEYEEAIEEQPYVIYKEADGIVRGLNPFPQSTCSVVMVIGDREWDWTSYFCSGRDDYDKVITVTVADRLSPEPKSCVKITYERILHSVQAVISLMFDGDVTILGGGVLGSTICSDNEPRPSFVLGHFPRQKRTFVANEILPLSRSSVNIPWKSKFRVEFGMFLAAEKNIIKLNASCDIDVPDTPGKHVFMFQLDEGFPKLKLEASWSYDTHKYDVEYERRKKIIKEICSRPPPRPPLEEMRIQEWKKNKNCPKRKNRNKQHATDV